MANTFLVHQREVALPDPPPQEETRMPEPTDVWPRFLFPAGGPTEPDYGGRCFNSLEEVAAAEGQWFTTPQEAATPTAQAPAPDDNEPHVRRSHR
jgi:hypothetical protein